MKITISDTRDIILNNIIELYKANKWSSADKPNELYNALINSHIGFCLGWWWISRNWECNFWWIFSGILSTPLVHPNYQGKGIGQKIVAKMQEKYRDFHMQMLTADGKAIQVLSKSRIWKSRRNRTNVYL